MNLINELLTDSNCEFSSSPFAAYLTHMDCIRIHLRDCSYFERRLNDHVTVILDNYPKTEQRQVIGLVLKGVSALLNLEDSKNLELELLTNVLDAYVKQYPEIFTDEIQALFDQLNNLELTVKKWDLVAA